MVLVLVLPLPVSLKMDAADWQCENRNGSLILKLSKFILKQYYTECSTHKKEFRSEKQTTVSGKKDVFFSYTIVSWTVKLLKLKQF